MHIQGQKLTKLTEILVQRVNRNSFRIHRLMADRGQVFQKGIPECDDRERIFAIEFKLDQKVSPCSIVAAFNHQNAVLYARCSAGFTAGSGESCIQHGHGT